MRLLPSIRTLLFLAVCLFALPAFAAPGITLTATAANIAGSPQSISISVALIDPNSTGMLRVSGTGIIPIVTASTATPGATATVGPIYGNDVIINGFGNVNATYYSVQVFAVTNGIIASTPSLGGYYAFTGSGTIDLATATPLAPSFMTGTGGAVSVPGNFSVVGNSAFAGNVAVGGTLGVTGVSNLANIIVNPAATITGAALTVGGTSTTTGGMSIFIGALGGGTERAAIYPADGSSATFRVGSLSVRAVSGGFLTGAESLGISSSGVVTGATLTSPVVNRETVNTGISQGSGLKHQRIASCTTAATTGALCTTTLTWTSAFPDTSYTVSCQVRGLNAIGHIGQQGVIAASVALTLVADTATATSGEFDCIAIHD